MARLSWFAGVLASPLPHPKRGIECVEESRLAERLEEALYGSICKDTGPDGFVSARGDEDDRDVSPATCQLALKIRPRHPWHRDVEDQTARLTDDIRCEERFG